MSTKYIYVHVHTHIQTEHHGLYCQSQHWRGRDWQIQGSIQVDPWSSLAIQHSLLGEMQVSETLSHKTVDKTIDNAYEVILQVV